MATPVTVATGETIAVSWGNAVRDWAAFGEVDASVEVAAVALTTSLADVASVSLSIPVGWAAWSCFAMATYAVSDVAGSGIYQARLRIDGTDQQIQDASTASTLGESGSVVARRTGMVTTGSRAVSLRMLEGAGDACTVTDICLYARAVRTS